jgi:hypothetical protein
MTAPVDRAGLVRVMAETYDPDAFKELAQSERSVAMTRAHRDFAQVMGERFLAAIEDAGSRVVPMVLTKLQKERVLANGGETAVAWATAAWPDLLAASPFAPPQGDKP